MQGITRGQAARVAAILTGLAVVREILAVTLFPSQGLVAYLLPTLVIADQFAFAAFFWSFFVDSRGEEPYVPMRALALWMIPVAVAPQFLIYVASLATIPGLEITLQFSITLVLRLVFLVATGSFFWILSGRGARLDIRLVAVVLLISGLPDSYASVNALLMFGRRLLDGAFFFSLTRSLLKNAPAT